MNICGHKQVLKLATYLLTAQCMQNITIHCTVTGVLGHF